MAAPPNQPATLSPSWLKTWVVFVPFARHYAQDFQSPEPALRCVFFFDLETGGDLRILTLFANQSLGLEP